MKLAILLTVLVGIAKADPNMTEAQYKKMLSNVETIYRPVITKMGGRLAIQRLWKTTQPLAYASKRGRSWTIVISGGLARKPNLSEDGLLVILCHEMGHLVGGAPHRRQVSVEGEADYYSTSKCMRRVLENENNGSFVRQQNVPKIIRSRCSGPYNLAQDKDLCIRIALAAFSASEVDRNRCLSWMKSGQFTGENKRRCMRMGKNKKEAVRKLNNPVSFKNKEARIVRSTYSAHNSPQCRLDTLMAGALCDKDPWQEISFSNPSQGACTRGVGVRPACWYK